MSAAADLVTVYRSMDASAKEDCEMLIDMLGSNAIDPVLVDDSAPGVPSGVYEIRVPAAQAPRAEQLIAENPPPDEDQAVDPSAGLDLETVFQAGGTSAELQALGVQSLLESNGIDAVLWGDSVLPNLPFEVKVARVNAESARQLIAEAEQTGEEPEAEPSESAE